MSAPYVRAFYGVKFKRGDHVKVDGRRGVIVSFPDQYLGVRFDGEKRTSRCHPTWRVELDSGLTLEDLLALPDGSKFIDAFGDVGTIHGGVVTYPETADMSAERAVKKYSPLRLIATPDPDACDSFGCDPDPSEASSEDRAPVRSPQGDQVMNEPTRDTIPPIPTNAVYVPMTGKWWEPLPGDPERYRTVAVCDTTCHHPIHAFRPKRRRHTEDAAWILANAQGKP